MRVAGLAAALALVLAAGAQGAADHWKGLPYFDYERHELFVGTDSSWTGAKQFEAAKDGNRPAWAAERPLASIWTAKCARRGQSVTFSRSFDAPGPASAGTAFLRARRSAGRLRNVRLLVNGKLVARLASRPRPTGASLPAEALEAFRVGSNTVQLKARRTALRRRCNRRGGEKIGLVAGLFAQFRTDVVVGSGPKREYSKATPGSTRTDALRVQVATRGPAVSVGGGFGVTVRAGSGLEILLVEASAPAPFAACQVETVQELREARVTCPWVDDLASGSERTVALKVTSRLADAASVTHTSWRATWAAFPGDPVWSEVGYTGSAAAADPVSTNNAWELEHVFCMREPSGEPGCADAT